MAPAAADKAGSAGNGNGEEIAVRAGMLAPI